MSDKKHDVNAVTTEPNVEDQDYIYTPVPQNKRYGWIKMFFVWLCWNVVVGDLATGTALGSSMKFRDALIALSIGDIILVAVMIMTVYIGSKTGLAAMSLIRFTVGRGRNLYFLGDYLCDLSGLVCHPVGLLWADLVSVYSDKRTDPGSAGRNYDGIYSD